MWIDLGHGFLVNMENANNVVHEGNFIKFFFINDGSKTTPVKWEFDSFDEALDAFMAIKSRLNAKTL